MNEQIVEQEMVDTDTVDTEESRQFERRTAQWRLVIFGILLTFIALLFWGLRSQMVSERRVSGKAPEFEFTTFAGDEVIRLSDLQGQGVVLNFWASWCAPCREEAVLLEQTWRREQGNGIVFVGLDYLDQNHAALAYLKEFDVTYPNGVDKQSTWARRYGIEGVPETFFIAPDGTIADILIGPLLSQADLDNRLDKIRPDK